MLFMPSEWSSKQIIDSPTVVYIPAGLFHGPIVFTKVNKPVLFIDIAMTNQYGRAVDLDNKPKA